MAVVELSKSFTIVYSLNDAGNTGVLLPRAFIADIQEDGTPGYIKAQATHNTLDSYGLESTIDEQKELLEYVDQLSVQTLEHYFNKRNKRKISLVQFFGDSSTQKIIRQYIDKKLVEFIDKVKDQNAHLCLNLERKIPVKERLLKFAEVSLKPGLFFCKTVKGINYTLELVAETVFVPSKSKIRIIADKPGRIIVRDTIFALQNINANKITPFLAKEKLFIPATNVVEFFNKFLKDVLLHADIETDGFDVEVYDNLDEAILGFAFDFFESVWVAEVSFRYKNHIFLPGDRSRRKTLIHFSENGEVHVFQIRRNALAEGEYESRLLSLGLVRNVTGRFQISEGGKFDIFNLPGMTELGQFFSTKKAEIDGRAVIPADVSEQISYRKKQDWFELYGLICINGQNYQIRSFYKNILENDPFFRLKDGNYIVLPQVIMTKYRDLAVFGKDEMLEWRIPKTYFALVEQLDKSGINNPNAVKTVINDLFVQSDRLQVVLRPYQLKGAAWLYQHYKEGLGACLADDMGLGKTLQTLAVLTRVKDELKQTTQRIGTGLGMQLDLFQIEYSEDRAPLQALIVMPASLIFNWENEIRKFAPSLMVCRHIGNKRHKKADLLKSYDAVLTSYQTLYTDAEIFRSIHFRFVILDESQYIKNRNSQIFTLVNSLQADCRFSLSGTPVENSLADLWSQMEFINKHILKTYRFFKEHFQIPIEQKKDQETIGKLRNLVNPYILRRTKQQVAPDLPELMEQHVFCEMNDEHKTAYEAEKSAARNYLLGLDKAGTGYRMHVFSLLQRLRRIACNPNDVIPDYQGSSSKIDMVYYKMDEVLQAGKKLLIFSTFHSYLDDVAAYLSQNGVGYRMLTGDTPVKSRGVLVSDFQTRADIKVFLIALKAGGSGLNLTEADYVFIIDPWWNPFAENQAISRAHRIGREKPVFVLRFITKDTIEDKILALQKDKLSVSAEVIYENDVPKEVLVKTDYLLE